MAQHISEVCYQFLAFVIKAFLRHIIFTVIKSKICKDLYYCLIRCFEITDEKHQEKITVICTKNNQCCRVKQQTANKLNFTLPLKSLEFIPDQIWAQLFCPNIYMQSICNASLIKLFLLLPVNRNIADLHRGSGSLKALQRPDGKCDRKLKNKHFVFSYILITLNKG